MFETLRRNKVLVTTAGIAASVGYFLGTAAKDSSLSSSSPLAGAPALDESDGLDQSALPAIAQDTTAVSALPLDAALVDHPITVLFDQVHRNFPLANSEEIALLQAEALCKAARQGGPVWQGHIARALEQAYPRGCDFELVRLYLDIFDDAFPESFSNQEQIDQMRKSTFRGEFSVTPNVSEKGAGLNIKYSVRPWEHPADAIFYTLNMKIEMQIDSSAQSETKTEVLAKRIPITPDPTITWNFEEQLLSPHLRDGDTVTIVCSLQYNSMTSRTDFRQGHDEPMLTGKTTFRVVADDDGNLSVIPEQGDSFEKTTEALIAGLEKTRKTIEWERKLRRDPHLVLLQEHVTKQTHLNPPLLNNMTLENPWQPQSTEQPFKKLTLVEFSAMTCSPCLAALPGLAELSEEQSDIDIVALFPDNNDDGIEHLSETPPIGVYQSNFNRLIGIHKYPTTMLVDSNGRVQWVGIGTMKPGLALIERLQDK